MNLFAKNPGPLCLVNFTQPWTQKLSTFDIFFDTFSNYLILHKEGYFLLWEEFDRGKNTGKTPHTLNLATI